MKWNYNLNIIILYLMVQKESKSDFSMKKEELIGVLEQFYTKEKQEQYGVLGIRIELV